MHWYFNPYALILFICALATVWVGVYAWRQRAQVGAGPALTLLGTAIWSLGYAVATGVHDLTWRIFWAKVQHLGIALTPVAMAVFVLHYIGREKWLTRRNLALLAAVPFVGMLLAWTNEVHGLIWAHVNLKIVRSLALLDLSYGPYFWFYFAYNYLVLLGSAVIFLRAALRSPHLQRRQAAIMLIGTLCPGVAILIYLTGLSPLRHLDLAPLGYSLCSLVLAWGIFRYRLLDIVPVARDKVIENMTDGVIVLDTQGRVVDANPTMLQLIGRSAGEVVGRPVAQFLAGRLDLVEPCQEVPKAQVPITMGEGKTQRYFDLRISPLYGGQNKLAGRVVVLRDTTERMRAEEALRDSEERYRSLVANAMDAIFIVQEELIKFPNPFTLSLTGYSQEELTTLPFFNFIHPDDRHMVIDNHRRRLKGEEVPTTYSFRIIDKKGEELWGQINAALITWDGRPAVLCFFRDITPQKRLEAQYQHAQKMESIGTLAGGIAHDFNNILTSVLGYAELASLDTPENSKAQYNLQQSIKAAHRAKDLVQQILAFSRQSKQERKPLDIEPIVKEGLKLVRASLPTTIEIRQNMEEDLGAIEADTTQIHQVLMNLCTNAAHAMSENGGVLEVSLTKFDMDAEASAASPEVEPGPYLRLRVSDTGHGMTPEILQRVFDPYFTTKEPGKGTGLGLAVVHGIVKSYGGGVTVSSEPGRGTTFDIYFPKIEPVKGPLEAGRIEPLPVGGHERVLVVDDEKAIVEIGQEILQHLGYEVVVRTSSVEALELFRAQPERFDLVITDMTMPNMTGDKLAVELMRIRPDIPVILCTGFSERITKEKAESMGIREFLLKPLVMNDLARVIHRVIDQNKKGG